MFSRKALACLLLSSSVLAQQPPTTSSPDVIFRADTRIVLVDAIVRDSKGQFVRGLTAADFEVKENGKPQAISSVNYVSSSAARAKSKLPPGVFTNDPQYQDRPLTYAVLLIDMINTPLNDRLLMRESVRKFVTEQLKPDYKLAIFLLTDRLQLLQDFTSDPKLLKKIAESYNIGYRDATTKIGEDAKKELQRLLEQETQGRKLDTKLEDDPTSGYGNTMEGQLRKMIDAWDRLEDIHSSYQNRDRAELSASAMKAISRWLRGISGRKSLVWMSGSFPIALTYNDRNIRWYQREIGSFDVQVRQATDALNQAQVAIYPVDVRGLTPTLSGERTTAAALRNAQLGNTFNAEQGTSTQLADSTGGRAFANRNDLDQAISAALEDGREYYTIAYYPQDKNWDGKFREISLKVKAPNANARYRKGYLATAPVDWKIVRGEREVAALLASPLNSTELPFYAALTETSKQPRQGVVTLSLPSSALNFEATGDGFRSAPSFFVLSLAEDGKALWTDQKAGEIRLNAEQFSKVREQGIRYPLQVQIPEHTTRLRLAIRDGLTGSVGTVDIPVKPLKMD